MSNQLSYLAMLKQKCSVVVLFFVFPAGLLVNHPLILGSAYLDSFLDMPTGSLHSHSLCVLCRARYKTQRPNTIHRNERALEKANF